LWCLSFSDFNVSVWSIVNLCLFFSFGHCDVCRSSILMFLCGALWIFVCSFPLAIVMSVPLRF
jgi:hypothetical protein